MLKTDHWEEVFGIDKTKINILADNFIHIFLCALVYTSSTFKLNLSSALDKSRETPLPAKD